MKIKELFKDVELKNNISLFEDTEIKSLKYDTRMVEKGDAFFCLTGENSDGHDYAEDAEKNGATAIVCDRQLDVDIPQIIVKNVRKAFSVACGNYYENPAKKLKMIALTGTNGKTTTTFLIKSILECANKRVGLIGTQGSYIGQQYFQSNLTTPDPEELHKILKAMVDNKVEYVVMEASAHAIALEKLEGIVFEVGVFTNLTQDHLDFFKTMDNYQKVKSRLFLENHIKTAVLNFDDKVGLELSKKINVPMVSYGLSSPVDVFAIDIAKKSNKTEYVVNLLDNIFTVESKFLGDFNVYNSLAAATACSILGIDCKYIKKGLENITSVPGRLNCVTLSSGALAIIDFAHTPDGLEKALTTIKELSFNRIITVFGCSGNRDKSKRPQMGKIVEKLSDFTIISSDNPRFENPELIIDDIESGMMANTHIRIVDRKMAVEFAVELARQGDIIAICGKGAEEYQDVNGVKMPYNDYETVILKDEEIKIRKFAQGE